MFVLPCPIGVARLVVAADDAVAVVRPANPMGVGWGFMRPGRPGQHGLEDAEQHALALLTAFAEGDAPLQADDSVALPLAGHAWIIRLPGGHWAMTGDAPTAADLASEGGGRSYVSPPVPVLVAVMDLEVELDGRGYQYETPYLARHAKGWLVTTDAGKALAFLGAESGLFGTVHHTSDNAVAAVTLRAINDVCRRK